LRKQRIGIYNNYHMYRSVESAIKFSTVKLGKNMIYIKLANSSELDKHFYQVRE